MINLDVISKELIKEDLLDKAYILAGEEAWTSKDALEVAKWAEKNNILITGVELWHREGDSPVWIATSNFDPKNVQKAAEDSKAFILKFGDDKEALFNFSW